VSITAGPEPRLRRLEEELIEIGIGLPEDHWPLFLVELDYALRPPVHERRVPTYGAIVQPLTDPGTWTQGTNLGVTRRSAGGGYLVTGIRKFADGLASWMIRRGDHDSELVVFDRPVASERDLAVLAEVTSGTLVQRHPMGWVRAVGSFGAVRWDGMTWHHEPPIQHWIDSIGEQGGHVGDRDVIMSLLKFAVHDLGARGVGALLVYQPMENNVTVMEERLAVPPPLQISRAADLAPLSHVLGQVDGAAVFDESGTLRTLGARLVPSRTAEADVVAYRGMRHTAGRRFSYDDPSATVIVVSDDGPVTVIRAGELLGSSSESA